MAFVDPAPGILSRLQDFLDRRYSAVRRASLDLTEGLTPEDMTPQSMEDASPVKWHLAHTTWFFAEFFLKPFTRRYPTLDPVYAYLFNSYYETMGERHPRAKRGLLTRPSVDEIKEYRHAVDRQVEAALDEQELPAEASRALELGLQHEEQHQELILTDLLHLLAQNPLGPVYRPRPIETPPCASGPARFVPHSGGLHSVGHGGDRFAFDCETPRHQVFLRPFALSDRPVTNGEWLEFMADGGYETPTLWLSDGWATARREGWTAPLYWKREDGGWSRMSLHGREPVRLEEPVCHISYFEADAFARWADKRLPIEQEWEIAAEAIPLKGHFADRAIYSPLPASGPEPLHQMYGSVWEWTMSPYMSYPGFRPLPGAAGEYNGKFMCGQFVLRGGSCATPPGHIRASYRNFFYPHQRWQFSGLRLAEDR